MARKVALSEGARAPDGAVDLGAMAESIAFQLRQTSYAVHQAFGRRFSPADAVPRQYSVLQLIEANSGISVKDLAAAIGVDQSTLVPTLNVCEERGWISRTRSTRDRRVASLDLTAPGRAELHKVQQAICDHEAEVTRSLSANERRQLLEMLRRVRASAEQA